MDKVVVVFVLVVFVVVVCVIVNKKCLDNHVVRKVVVGKRRSQKKLTRLETRANTKLVP